MLTYREFLREFLNPLTMTKSSRLRPSHMTELEVQSRVRSKIRSGVEPRVLTVHPDQVRGTQSWVRAGLHGTGSPPVHQKYSDKPTGVLDSEGNVHIDDGHHRANAAARENRPLEVYAWEDQ